MIYAEKTNDCGICLEPCNSMTLCNHNFHVECMIKWINTGNFQCPVCRTLLNDESHRNNTNTNTNNEYLVEIKDDNDNYQSLQNNNQIIPPRENIILERNDYMKKYLSCMIFFSLSLGMIIWVIF